MHSTREFSGLSPLQALPVSTAPQLQVRDRSCRPGEGEETVCAHHHPPKTDLREGRLPAPHVQGSSLAQTARARFVSPTYPLPRPQNRYDRISDTQDLTVLVRHLPKVPLTPRTLSTKARPRRGQDCSVLFWIWGLTGPHPTLQRGGPAWLSWPKLLRAHSPVHTRHRDKVTPPPTCSSWVLFWGQAQSHSSCL